MSLKFSQPRVIAFGTLLLLSACALGEAGLSSVDAEGSADGATRVSDEGEDASNTLGAPSASSAPSDKAVLDRGIISGGRGVFDHDDPAFAEYFKSFDDKLLDIEAEAPGFGGYWFEGDTMLVRLKDPSLLATAEKALDRKFHPSMMERKAVVAVPSEYSFSELKAVHEEYGGFFMDSDGVVSIDTDEVENRVVVGVADNHAKERMEKALGAMNAPTAKILVRPNSVAMPNLNMRDRQRPMAAGLKITLANDTTSPRFQGACTHGFALFERAGSLYRWGVATNSHCTSVIGGVPATPDSLYQPTKLAANLMGKEDIDPPWNASNCSAAIRRASSRNGCRKSDSAMFLMNSTSTATPPTTPVVVTGTSDGSILGASTFVAKGAVPAIGKIVVKTGYTTGSTQGKISATCVDRQTETPNRWLLCEYEAKSSTTSPMSRPGDSGAPVFVKATDGTATAVGIDWGGSSDGSIMSFSEVSALEAELYTNVALSSSGSAAR
jgi:hypothetical protein